MNLKSYLRGSYMRENAVRVSRCSFNITSTVLVRRAQRVSEYLFRIEWWPERGQILHKMIYG